MAGVSNLRIVADNAIERATVTASNTAGLLAAANLLTTDKSEIWRGLGKTERLTATWPAAEIIQAVAFPFCNWSPTAMKRVRLTNEPQVTNLFLYSEQLDNATWLKNSYTTVTGTYTLAPDGTNTAETLQGTGGSNSYAYQSITLAAGASYPVSCFVKAGTHVGDFQIHDFTENGTVVLNLTSLAVSANGTFSGARVDSVGNGWYRISAVIRPTVAGAHSIGLWCVTSTGTVFVWGAMLASGSGLLTSYYPSNDTFTSRASTATYFGSDGLLKQASVNVARMQYNPANLAAPPKLLLEAAATNLTTYSQQFDNAAWTKTRSTVVANASASPDGTLTMGKLVCDTSLGTHFVYQNRSATNETVTFSVFVKAAELSQVRLAMSNNVSYGAGCIFDLSTGTIISTDAANQEYTNIYGYIVNLGGGMYRCVITSTKAAVSTYNIPTVTLCAAGVQFFQGDGVKGIYIWGAQLETGAFASSLVPTTSATVTRAADLSASTPGVRPLGYIDNWQSYDYDSGLVLACPAPAVTLRGWTAAAAASAYAYGGGAYARHWMPAAKAAVGLAVDIADPNNLQSALEAACMVAGPVWMPRDGASDAPMTPVDTTTDYRTDAGSLRSDAGYIYRQMSIDLSMMATDDRAALVGILRNSRAYPILFGLYAGWADLALERDHLIYGCRSEDSKVAIEHAMTYSTTITLEEI